MDKTVQERATMEAIQRDGQWVVEDGAVWWPSDEAREQIDASSHPAAEAARSCSAQPMRGVWRD